jgi:hypothetical protein
MTVVDKAKSNLQGGPLYLSDLEGQVLRLLMQFHDVWLIRSQGDKCIGW